MKSGKSIWLKSEFSSKKKIPSWPCPICELGVLQKDGESIQQLYSEETKRGSNNLFYQTKALAEFRFVGYLKCTNCDERIVITGEGRFFNELDQPVNAGFKGKRYSVFYPKFFEPNLRIIDLPSSLNSSIAEMVNKSFVLFWVDLDSCANKIRKALEQITIDNSATGDKLHGKIESLRKQLGDSLTDTLLAIKWAGNEGSHLGPPFTRDHILDIYSLLKDVLHQLYPDITEIERKEQLVKNINTNKGIKGL
jgi:hypothetical protein